MPEYEFECMQCHAEFTERMSFREHDQRKQVQCPKCNSKNVKQVITPAFARTSKKS